MRLNTLYLMGALAVAAVPLSAVAQPVQANRQPPPSNTRRHRRFAQPAGFGNRPAIWAMATGGRHTAQPVRPFLFNRRPACGHLGYRMIALEVDGMRKTGPRAGNQGSAFARPRETATAGQSDGGGWVGISQGGGQRSCVSGRTAVALSDG